MKTVTLFIALYIFCSLSFAQEDVKGSKDHPLFNRMPGYRIIKYDEVDFNVYKDFKIENGKKVNVEGYYYYLNYGHKKR